MKKTIVIAIAAVSGGGKTTVVNELSKRLHLSKTIYFDDYEFDEGPDDFFQWIQDGSDYNAWNIETLAKDIEVILTSENYNYILLDYPFAYRNDKLASYIDYAVFIDTPLDIAMARRILRDKLDESSYKLKDDLNYYLSKGRLAYLEMLKSIKPNSDLVVDGSLSLKDIVYAIMEKIDKFDI